MPRHPETVIEPNTLLSDARKSLPSPNRHGQHMSRAELADAVNNSLDQLHPGRDMTAQYVDFRWIGKLERGEHRWPSAERRTALRRVFGATTTDNRLGLYSPRRTEDQLTSSVLSSVAIVAAADRPAHPAGNAQLDLLRKMILTGGPGGPGSDDISSDQVRRATAKVHQVYQQAQYVEAAAELPAALGLANDLASRSTGAARRRGEYLLALNYIAAAKVATKFADGPLAWVAAERAAQIASTIDAPEVIGIAAYQTSCALLQLYPDGEPAEHLTQTSLSILSKVGMTAQTTAVTGALHLIAAIIAARRSAQQAAVEHLAIASKLADSLSPDGNELWTAFNRTNVLIHRVSTEISLRRYDDAIQAGQQIDSARLPETLAGRRAQIHLDLATAYAAHTDSKEAAVHHIVSASCVAPQLFRIQPSNRQLVATLLRSSNSRTPALRALAEQHGIEA